MLTQAYFSNIRETILDNLDLAQQEVLVAMAWLTDAQLWDKLLSLQKRGVSVKVLMAKDEINSRSGLDYQALSTSGGQFYIKDMSHVGTYSKMHNKFCVIDGKICITGSYNWTNQAQKNDENIIVLNDGPTAEHFGKQFQLLCEDAINIHHLDNDFMQFRDAYQKKATRKEPTALLILLDQSGSMASGQYEVNGIAMNRAKAAAFYVNTLLDELLAKCTKDDGLRDYVEVCLLGYGAEEKRASPAWCGKLTGKTWVSINELQDNASQETREVERNIRGKISKVEVKIRYWLEGKAESLTPMGNALEQAHDLLKNWIEQHKTSFPPILINITDGQATDVKAPKLIELAGKIKDLQTHNGRVLFFNCHLGNDSSKACLYPKLKTELPSGEAYAETLFEMSSILPKAFHNEISSHTPDFDANGRYAAMFYNADAMGLTRILQLGTSKI